MTYHPSTKGTHSQSDNYPTNIINCPIEDVAARTAKEMNAKKASENLLRAIQRGRTRTTRER
ncbi:hypothetical protein ACTXT7_001350 [Hymenolepis weldensis]